METNDPIKNSAHKRTRKKSLSLLFKTLYSFCVIVLEPSFNMLSFKQPSFACPFFVFYLSIHTSTQTSAHTLPHHLSRRLSPHSFFTVKVYLRVFLQLLTRLFSNLIFFFRLFT